MIYIVPSELRKTSNLLKYISGVDYVPLPGLEALTGADAMISPSSMPFPRNDKVILSHIKGGAKLIQIKFGHDLPGSITDGRLKEALFRMQACGAAPWQCLLLFVGMIGRDETRGNATIDGQLSYGKYPIKWANVDQSLNYWIDRGGVYYNLPSGKLIPDHFTNTQKRLDEYTTGGNIRKFQPKPPVFYNEIEPDNQILKDWGIGQKLVMIDDFRRLLCVIPGCRIGPEKANAIYDWMNDNNVHMSFNGFLAIVRDESILEVKGIGKGLLKSIRTGLFNEQERKSE